LEGTSGSVALGFSLSGNTLLRHLARGAAPRPTCAVAISPPIDLENASRALSRWPARALEALVVARCRQWPERYGLEKAEDMSCGDTAAGKGRDTCYAR